MDCHETGREVRFWERSGPFVLTVSSLDFDPWRIIADRGAINFVLHSRPPPRGGKIRQKSMLILIWLIFDLADFHKCLARNDKCRSMVGV